MTTNLFQVCFSLAVLASFVLAQRSGTRQQKQIRCNQKDIEALLDKIMVVSHKERNFPENQQELKKFCTESNQLLNTLAGYKDQCFKGKETIRNFISIFMYSMKSSIKRICTRKNSPPVVALIDASSCINRNKPFISKCMETTSNNYAAIQSIDNSKKLPHICCQIGTLLQCFSEVMTKNGCEDKLPVLLENITGVLGNFLDATCGEYDLDSDKCDQLSPLPKVKAKSKNFVTNLVDVFNSVE